MILLWNGDHPREAGQADLGKSCGRPGRPVEIAEAKPRPPDEKCGRSWKHPRTQHQRPRRSSTGCPPRAAERRAANVNESGTDGESRPEPLRTASGNGKGSDPHGWLQPPEKPVRAHG